MPESNKTPKKSHASMPLLVAIIGTILLIMFIVVALLLQPVEALPVFTITDQNGDWDAQAQGRIAIFDGTIHPGKTGKYEFVIQNDSDETLIYGFRLTEYLNNSNYDHYAFMNYRLWQDDIPLGDGKYHTVGVDFNNIRILPGSRHTMTLEWYWPFEAGHDEADTLLGRVGGKLGVHIFIWAEVAEEGITW